MAQEEQTTLRQKVLAVLTQRGEALSYRDLTDLVWSTYPQYKAYFVGHYSGNENKARQELRIQLGNLVKSSPGVFTATKTEGVVLVGLAATEADSAEDLDDEAESVEAGSAPAVYWYTFPAYKRPNGPYPIKSVVATTRSSESPNRSRRCPNPLKSLAHLSTPTL